MLQAVDRLVKKNDLFKANQTVIVGVSGGPDSMALLYYLWSNQSVYDLNVIVAHVDHQFRGKESEYDAQFVEKYCENKGIIFEGTRINVRKHIQSTGKNPQLAARDCRYQFFKEVMCKYEADVLALAHHGDDQIETMLMHLVNGIVDTGSLGISIKRPFEKGVLVRPFLGITKAQIEQYCNVENIPYRIDQSNFNNKYTRNRFRSTILPFIKKENMLAHERFQQFSEHTKEDAAYLMELARKVLETDVEFVSKSKCVFEKTSFLSIPKPLQRRVIHLILNYLYQDNHIRVGNIHIDDCLQLIESSGSSGEIHLPRKVRFIKSYNKCIFSSEPFQNQSPYEMSITPPCVIPTPIGTIECKVETKFPAQSKLGKYSFVCNVDQVKSPLLIRTRRNGDRIHLKGKSGSKKLKDIFIDHKIPLYERDVWPIITDVEGEIIWVPGLKHSSVSRIDKKADRWFHLSFYKNEFS